GDDGSAAFTLPPHCHDVVLLPALPAEGQRKEELGPIAWSVCLAGGRDVTICFGLQRGVCGLATADELVETKGEHRKASDCAGDVLTSHELSLDEPEGLVLGKIHESSKLPTRPIRSGQ